MKDRYDYLIVGTGLFGSVFAHEAIAKGKSVLMVEKRNHIAGNIYTEKVDGINIHRYGAHIFHTSDETVWEYINRFASFNNFINSPIAKYGKEVYNMPFNMNTFSRMWGISTPAEAKAIIDSQRREIETVTNLEEQAISLVGRDIYEKLIKGYTEKQWGRSCTELPPEIIKRLPVRYTYDNNYFNDRYQGIPTEGYTSIVEKLIEGADVVLGEDFNLDQARWRSLADRTLYTGCLDEFFHYSEGRLQYRSEIFESERIEEENYQGVAVVNYTERDVPYTRVIEHKHFAKDISPVTWISREYPVDYEKTGEPYYPINDERNDSLYRRYRKLADADSSLIIGGRLAEYKYYDMDKTVLSALRKAEEII